MVEFRVVAGEDFFKYFDDFIKEYNKGTAVKEIISLLGISYKKYCKYLERGVSEGLIVARGKGNNHNVEPKYYCHTGNRFEIYKRIDGKMKYFGSFKSEEDARCHVEKLKACNWRV